MNNFDAKQARELVNSVTKYELPDILDSIEKLARGGYSKYYVDRILKNETLSELIKRGFMVRHPSLDVQKEGIYYTISW